MAKEVQRAGETPGKGVDLAHWLLYSPNGKIVLIAGAGLIGLFVVRRLLINRHAVRERARKEDLIRTQPVEKGPTITTHTARVLADKLFQAMEGNGTNEPAIHQVMNELRTDGDLKLVREAFGVRSYGSTGGNSSWWAETVGWSTPMTLDDWLRAELSGEDLRMVQAHYRRMGLTL